MTMRIRVSKAVIQIRILWSRTTATCCWPGSSTGRNKRNTTWPWRWRMAFTQRPHSCSSASKTSTNTGRSSRRTCTRWTSRKTRKSVHLSCGWWPPTTTRTWGCCTAYTAHSTSTRSNRSQSTISRESCRCNNRWTGNIIYTRVFYIIAYLFPPIWRETI